MNKNEKVLGDSVETHPDGFSNNLNFSQSRSLFNSPRL
jgi:hypothetical protein